MNGISGAESGVPHSPASRDGGTGGGTARISAGPGRIAGGLRLAGSPTAEDGAAGDGASRDGTARDGAGDGAARADLGPVGPGTVEAAGLAAGVWAGGNAVYDNWESLAGDPEDPATPIYTPAEAQAAADLLLQPLTRPVQELLCLTDEELRAVDGPGVEPLTPTPWLDQHPGTGATTVASEATATAPVATTAASDDTVPDARAVGVLRRTADAVIIAERVTDRGTAFGYFFVFTTEDEGRVLAEVFDATGEHLFFLLEEDTLREQLICFVDPQGVAGPDDGSTAVIEESAFASSPSARRLAGALAVTDVLVVERSTSERYAFSLVATPEAVEMMEVDGEDEDAVRRIGVLSRTSLAALFAELL